MLSKDNFDTQVCNSGKHAFVKFYAPWSVMIMGRKPWERLMGLLEGHTEEISGEFNSQEVANTL